MSFKSTIEKLISEAVAESFNELMNEGYEETEVPQKESEMPKTASKDVLAPMIGKNILVRAHREGVIIGKLVKADDEFFYLENSRMFWRWQADEGIALRSFCAYGPKEGTRATAFAVGVAPIRLDDLCGMYSVSSEVWQKFVDWPISEQN